MNRIPRFTRLVAALGLGLSLATTLLASRPAQAEGEIRIAEQFGIVYLLLNVVRDQRLIEKHGQAEGLQIKVDWTQLSGGAAVNDALLSGYRRCRRRSAADHLGPYPRAPERQGGGFAGQLPLLPAEQRPAGQEHRRLRRRGSHRRAGGGGFGAVALPPVRRG